MPSIKTESKLKPPDLCFTFLSREDVTFKEKHHNILVHCNIGKTRQGKAVEVERRRKMGSGGGEASPVPHSAAVSSGTS